MSKELEFIPAKCLEERDYGDRQKVKIIVPTRCSPEVYDNDGIDPVTQEDFTQMAVVGCNNKLGKGSMVWISYLDDNDSQPIIIRVFHGKTDFDTFGSGSSTGPNDNDDPNAIQLECGISLAELAVDVVASAERNYKWTSLNKRIEEEAYTQVNPDNINQALGIRQWNGSRAKSVFNYIYNQDKEQSKKIAGKYNKQVLAYNGKTKPSNVVAEKMKRILGTSYGKEAQRQCARTGEGDTGYGLGKLLQYGSKKGITNNASLLFFAELCNGYGTKKQWDLMAKYGKGDKSFKDFYNDLKSKNPKVSGVKGPMDSKPYNYLGRRKIVYHNIKMLEDAGWLKGKSGNLSNITNASSANNDTGWLYPVSDKNEEFKISGKWKTNNGIKITHKNNKSEGKLAVAVYKGTVKKINKNKSTFDVHILFNTKGNKKHYVEYIGLQNVSVVKGESIYKGAKIGQLTSSGLLFRTRKTDNKSSTYINPTDLIGSNKLESTEESNLSGKTKKTVTIPKSVNQCGLTQDFTNYDRDLGGWQWSKGTKQRDIWLKWKKQGKKTKKHVAVIDGLYLIAVQTGTFGSPGDAITVVLRDNTSFDAIIADTKKKTDPRSSSYGHYYGNKESIIEWELHNGKYKSVDLGSWEGKKVKCIKNKGKYIK